MNQQVRFARSEDGTRIAYAVTGNGPPIVRAPHWLSHLEYEWQSPVWRPWIEAFSSQHTLVRMDERGCGLSDRDVDDFSFEAIVADLEAVAEAAGFERFAVFGHSQGGAIAIEYAVRHPERVTHLVLLGSYSQGWLKRGLPPERVAELHAHLQLIEAGWGRDDASYRQMFASQFMPGSSLEQLRSLSEMQRMSASPENAANILRSCFHMDVRASLPHVRAPTLVIHARGDLRSPLEQGRILASEIPGARLVTLDTQNHILLEQEPSFARFFEELRSFVTPHGKPGSAFSELTVREAEILERIAQGLDNAQIAAHLTLSEKTVRNHITHIFDKIGVENRSQAIVLARDRGLGHG